MMKIIPFSVDSVLGTDSLPVMSVVDVHILEVESVTSHRTASHLYGGAVQPFSIGDSNRH